MSSANITHNVGLSATDTLHVARDGKWTYPAWVYGPADVHGPVQLEPDSTPTEYKTAGDPIPMSAFSLPYEGPHPAQGTCSICMDEFTDTGRDRRGLVVARCLTGHLFHSKCLNYWVNDSAMDNANLCPHDRERLCEPRQRTHPGELSDDSDVDESADGDLDMDAEESDAEGSDADAEGSDNDDLDVDAVEADAEGSDADAESSDDDDLDMDIEEDEDELHCAEELDEAAFFQFQQTGQDSVY